MFYDNPQAGMVRKAGNGLVARSEPPNLYFRMSGPCLLPDALSLGLGVATRGSLQAAEHRGVAGTGAGLVNVPDGHVRVQPARQSRQSDAGRGRQCGESPHPTQTQVGEAAGHVPAPLGPAKSAACSGATGQWLSLPESNPRGRSGCLPSSLLAGVDRILQKCTSPWNPQNEASSGKRCDFVKMRSHRMEGGGALSPDTQEKPHGDGRKLWEDRLQHPAEVVRQSQTKTGTRKRRNDVWGELRLRRPRVSNPK